MEKFESLGIDDIDYITIASEGNAVYFGDLIIKKQRLLTQVNY